MVETELMSEKIENNMCKQDRKLYCGGGGNKSDGSGYLLGVKASEPQLP